MTIRVVIAEDQAVVRAGLRMILDAQPDITVIGEANDGWEAIRLVNEAQPDLVLMDVQMPNLDGLDATRRLLGGGATGTKMKILVLTTFDLDEYVYEAILAGASGFLLKSAPPQQLVSGVRSVMAGDVLVAPEITRRLLDRFVQRPLPVAGRPTELADLSARELEVLEQLAEGHSNAEIAAAFYLSEATIKSHINHILTKLRLRDRVQAVALAYRCGLMDSRI
jgi:DNA-binding NarL/FixJ family response regulator